MTDEIDGFITGTDVIEEEEKAREEAFKAARAAASDYLRTLYFKDDKGNDIDSLVVRFITEATGVIKVAVHQGVVPKKLANGKGPKAVTAVCRNDIQVRRLLNLPEKDCYICNNKLPNAFGRESTPALRAFGLAALREEVIGDGSEALGGPELQGRSLGYADVPEKFEIRDTDGKGTGEYDYRPTIVVVMQAWKNFWAPLHHAWLMSDPYEKTRRTIRDKDFSIKKSGTGTEVTYSSFGLAPTPELVPGTPEWHERYEKPLEDRGITLAKHVLDLASDKHYAKWFNAEQELDKDGNIVPAGTVQHSTGSQSAPSPTARPAGAPVSPEVAAKMAALKAKLSPQSSS